MVGTIDSGRVFEVGRRFVISDCDKASLSLVEIMYISVLETIKTLLRGLTFMNSLKTYCGGASIDVQYERDPGFPGRCRDSDYFVLNTKVEKFFQVMVIPA